jgi:P27 family predicted phage terminase small subunit
MTRGRKPKPTALKLVGAGDGKMQILPPGMPPMPAFLEEIAQTEWARLAPILYQSNIITEVDGAALAAYCQAYARWEIAEKALKEMAKLDPATKGIMVRTAAGNVIENPVYSAAKSALRDMLRAAAEIGITPSARSRIEGKGSAQVDPISRKYFGA